MLRTIPQHSAITPATKAEKTACIAPNDPTVRFKAALIHNQFKEDDQTLEWLEKSAEAGYSITTIRDVPNFDHLWAYGRFQDLLRKY